MGYVGNSPAANFASVTKDLFSGDGSTVAFTLSKAATTNGVAVFVENVRQEPTIAYAVSGTTLTFTAAPVSASGNNIYVLHHNAVASTANHPASQDLTAVKGTFTGDVSIDGGSFVFNESSADKDFRVESNGNANMLFVDGGNNRVGIGGTPSVNLHIIDASDEGTPTFAGATHFAVQATASSSDNVNAALISGTAGVSRLFFGDKDDEDVGKIEYNNSDNDLAFFANTTERLKILSGGNTVQQSGFLKASSGTDKFYNGTDPSSGNWHEFNSTVGAEQILAITAHATGTNQQGFVIRHVPNTNNTTAMFISCGNDSNGTKFRVRGTGATENAVNSYGSTSDERLKSDITDAKSQWDDIKNIKVKNFKKYNTGDLVQLGVVAQEVEKISPSLVSNAPPTAHDIKHDESFGTLYTKDDSETQNNVLYTKDDQEVKDGDKKVGDIKTYAKKIGDVKEVKDQIKTVKYSVLYLKAVKALQEAMTRIETLETKVKALEDA